MARYTTIRVPRAHLHVLWREFVDLPFPTGVAGTTIEGIELVKLDREAGEMIESFLVSRGDVGVKHGRQIIALRRAIALVLPHLEGDAARYFTLLHDLVQHMLDEIAEHS